MKIYPLEAELFHVSIGQTDMTKQIVTFCNFVNAPNNLWYFGLYTASSSVDKKKK